METLKPVISPIVYGGKVYFKATELGENNTVYGRLAPGFGDKLLELRLLLNKPMHVNSCARSAAYNTEVGGHPRSLHVYDNNARGIKGACAIDIDTSRYGEEYRAELKKLAWQLGWSVGEYDTFLHLDRRSDYTDLPQTQFFG